MPCPYHNKLLGLSEISNSSSNPLKDVGAWVQKPSLPRFSVSSVQLRRCVWLSATQYTVAHQASLSITNPWNVLKLMSVMLVISFNQLILCCPLQSSISHFQSFPASGSFQKSQFLASGGQSIGVSASASVLPTNTQDWFPLGLSDWISLQSKGLSIVFSNTIQEHNTNNWAPTQIYSIKNSGGGIQQLVFQQTLQVILISTQTWELLG